MRTQHLKNRFARLIVKRSGPSERVEELSAHLDELEAHNRQITFLDIGSLALLAIRSLPYRASASAFLRPYAALVAFAVATWWLAVWVGVIGAAEGYVEETFAFEEFSLIGLHILLAFAVVAVIPAAIVVFATRGTR